MIRQSNGVKFQFAEVMLISGSTLYGFCGQAALGITLISLSIVAAFFRWGFDMAEKTKIAEKKDEEMSKIKDATSAILDGFNSGMKGGN